MIPLLVFLTIFALGETFRPSEQNPAPKDTVVTKQAILEKIQADFNALTEHDKEVHKALDEMQTMFKAYAVIQDSTLRLPKDFFKRPPEK